MKKIANIFTLNSVYILIIILIFELSMGKWIFGNRFDDLDIPVNRVQSFDISQLYAREPSIISYNTSELGFRGPDIAANDIEIVAIGGSTTKEGMIADGETWTDRLSAILSKESGRKITVANAGVDAQSTYGHVVALDAWLSKIRGLRPKAIIAMVGVNDQALGRPLRGFDDFQPRNEWERIRNYIWTRSALYDLYRRCRGVYRAYVTRVVHMSRSEVDFGEAYPDAKTERVQSPIPEIAEDLSVVYREHLAAYRKRLALLIVKIRGLGAIPIIVSQLRGDLVDGGNSYQFKKIKGYEFNYALRMFHGSRLYAETTMEVCREAGAVCIDMARELQIEPNERYDLVHTNPQGSKRIAEYLAAKISRSEFIASSNLVK